MNVPYDQNIYLLCPDKSFVPVEVSAVSFGRRGHIVLNMANGQQYQLISLTENLRTEFERAVDNLRRRTVANVLTITPEQVVMYFEASPVLRSMADDVRAALLSPCRSQIAAGDVARVKHLGPGASLADLAEVIYGRRHYGGSEHSYLKNLLNALQTSSSYDTDADSDDFEHRRAA